MTDRTLDARTVRAAALGHGEALIVKFGAFPAHPFSKLLLPFALLGLLFAATAFLLARAFLIGISGPVPGLAEWAVFSMAFISAFVP